MKTELELTLLVLLVSCSNDNFDFMHLHETELQNVKGPIVQSSSYETYYWSMGEKIPLTIDSSKCYVVVDELTYGKLKTNLSKDEKLTDLLLKDVASKGVIRNELYNEKYYSGVINTDLLSNENYIYKQYTYKEYNGESVGVTDEILVKLKDKADILILEKLSNELGYMIVDDNHTGTSFATPHVTGVAALILAKKRDLTRENVVEYILSSASKIPTYTFTNVRGKAYTFNEYVGYGLLDAFMALSTTPYPPYPPY